MAAALTVLRDEGREVLTLTLVHDPETTSFVPDLSHPMRQLFRFPWERGEATPAARALRATGAAADRRTEAPFVGLDLDGVFVPDIPRAEYTADVVATLAQRHVLEPFATVPMFVPQRAVVITGRYHGDRERHDRVGETVAPHGPARGVPAARVSRRYRFRDPLQGGGRHPLGLHTLHRKRSGTSDPHRRCRAASARKLVVRG